MNIYKLTYEPAWDEDAPEACVKPNQILIITADNYAEVESIIKPCGYIGGILKIEFLGKLFNPNRLRR